MSQSHFLVYRYIVRGHTSYRQYTFRTSKYNNTPFITTNSTCHQVLITNDFIPKGSSPYKVSRTCKPLIFKMNH